VATQCIYNFYIIVNIYIVYVYLNKIKRLVYIMENDPVFCEIGNEFL